VALFSQLVLLGLGIFLILVILLQRGRGGGLAGAFGGLGGQSAFGTKAGDVFTKITVVIAVAWVIVAGGSGYFLRAGAESRSQGLGDPEAEMSAGEDAEDADIDLGADADFVPGENTGLPVGGDTDFDTGDAATDTDDAASDSGAAETEAAETDATDAATPSTDDSASDPSADTDDSSEK